jgi:hypothetical protein
LITDLIPPLPDLTVLAVPDDLELLGVLDEQAVGLDVVTVDDDPVVGRGPARQAQGVRLPFTAAPRRYRLGD